MKSKANKQNNNASRIGFMKDVEGHFTCVRDSPVSIESHVEEGGYHIAAVR